MSRRALFLFVCMCVIWGIPYLFIRIAVGELHPVVLVFARTAIAAAILLPVAFFRGDVRPVLRFWLPLVIFAGLEVGVLALRETFTAGMAMGFVLVLIGSTLATRRRAPEAVPEVAP